MHVISTKRYRAAAAKIAAVAEVNCLAVEEAKGQILPKILVAAACIAGPAADALLDQFGYWMTRILHRTLQKENRTMARESKKRHRVPQAEVHAIFIQDAVM